eukprot:gene4517-20007_t
MRAVHCVVAAALRAALPRPHAGAPGAAGAGGLTWYVDAGRGSDAAGGLSPSAPFRSLTRARDAAAAARANGGLPAGGARIVARGGEYGPLWLN